ncbi:trihelix transcription factor DF1-like isoform X1 [Trifolium pratense]|uniref:trihelix transcription factor DF1-like isoform X1 n=1 Tax=Trifolium pratense TaxID=57577 RepID=UPI001E695D61|nr:trihelix transcription factor DF1-like isoform X1 [Trifolium pratense]
MDLFAAEHVAPFPDSGDLLFAAGLLSTHHNPQKLRPIRSVPPPPGYLVHSQSPPNPHPLEPSNKSQDPTESGSGHSQLPPGLEPGLVLFSLSCSSLDDDDDDDAENSSASTKEFGSRKKRKKTARKLEDFVSNLVKTVMEKQEQMHNELMEMIDKKEKERIQREEAWRREEMERIKKDEEARAAERARSLALISYIQKLLGQEIQIPQPEEESQKLLSRAIQIYQPAEGSGKREEGDVALSNNKRDFNGDPSNNRWPVVVNNNKRDFNGEPCNNRWPDAEVQALIAVRTALEYKFSHMGSKGSSIWEEISDAMRDRGYNRSAKKCKEKWENINKYYKRTVGSGRKRPLNSKTCSYFNELDNLYRNGYSNSLGDALTITNNVSISEEKEQGEI